jgi:hypothetical protein
MKGDQMNRKAVIAIACALMVFSIGACAQQASITLKNSDVAYCYKQDANWTLTKTNDSGYPTPVTPGATVNWTITATRGANGPKQLCAIGYVSVQNTGSAPATIGNVVVNLQRNTGKWTVISADVADATNGDAATSDKIVAGSLQNQTTYPAGIVAVSGAAATFTENSISGSMSFTDADSNTVWAITPAQTIPVGQTVNLFFNAVFNVGSISLNAGEQLRTEVFVTFGNAGARGGSGSTASNIDVNGNGVIDADEANVRTVPTRVTRPLPALQICNDTVTITDTFSSGTATVTLTTDPIGSGTTTGTSQTYTLTGTVGGSGELANTAALKGTGSTVTVTLGTDPVTLLPITRNLPCCEAVDLTANSNVLVGSELPPPTTHCSYTQGAYQGGGTPANILSANFSTAFPSGLTIGTYFPSNGNSAPNGAQWTQLSPLQSWLGGGGPSGALTADTLNATSTSGGALAKQTAALTINATLGTSAFGNPNISGLTLFGTGTSLDGLTVSQILGLANAALATGIRPAGYSFGGLNDLITMLNESWDNCSQSSWAEAHLQ